MQPADGNVSKMLIFNDLDRTTTRTRDNARLGAALKPRVIEKICFPHPSNLGSSLGRFQDFKHLQTFSQLARSNRLTFADFL